MPEQIHRFDAATNPYGPSPRVREALAAYALEGDYYHYGEARAESLRADLSAHWGLAPEHFIAYNGAGEALLWLFLSKLLLERGKLIVPAPSYERFVEAGKRCSVEVVQVPLAGEDFALLPEHCVAAGRRTGAQVLLLSSPNNPTGNALVDERALAFLLEQLPDCLCIVDEAYADYTGRSFVPWVRERENLVVLRTFSKAYGLAGLRIGYAVGTPRVVSALANLQIPWAVNSMGLVAARAALADQAYLQQIIARIADDCQALYAGLSALPWLKVYPSEANFFLLRFAGIAAEALRAGLEQEGIVARWRGDMPDCLRVTAQQTAANDHLLSVLAGIDASLRQGTPVDAASPPRNKGS